MAEITPTAFARTPIAPSVINAVTLDGLTLDVVVHPGSIFEFPASSTWQVGMMGGRFDNLNDALEHAVVEQFRGLCGPFISLVQRDEHLRHLAGVPHLLGLLTTVFLSEMNAPMPGKFWNETFTIEQRNAVARLPAVAADRTALIAFGLALAELLVSRARPEFIRRGIAWPAPFAAVVAARLHEQLDLDCTEWLR